MGLFGGGQTVQVASTVYNMAGLEEDRPNFLKTTVFSAIMSPYDQYLGETIVNNYLSGPGIKQRSFFNWCVNNDFLGMPTYTATVNAPLDPSVVEPFIPVPVSPAGLETVIVRAIITEGDVSPFAEQYIRDNVPGAADTNYVCEYLDDTHEIIIQYEGGSTTTFAAGSFDPSEKFVVAYYFQQIPSSIQDVIAGSLVTNLALRSDVPDLGDYTQTQVPTVIGSTPFTLNRTRVVNKTYDGGTPPTTTTTYPSTVQNYTNTEEILSDVVYNGGSGSIETSETNFILHIFDRGQVYYDSVTTYEYNTLPGGEIETVETILSGDYLRGRFDYRIDTQDTLFQEVVDGNKIWIYEIGSGNGTLDALVSTVEVGGTPEYYPYIPIRLKNRSIKTNPMFADSPAGNNMYAESKPAYYRASSRRQKFSKLVDEVEDNPDLDEIDFCFVQWGVSLNVVDQACRKYIYKYLKNISVLQTTTATTMADFVDMIDNYDDLKAAYDEWMAIQAAGPSANPLWGMPPPPNPVLVQPETTTIKLKTDDPRLPYPDNRMTWVNITETLFTGEGKPGAKKDELWFVKGTPIEWEEDESTKSDSDGYDFMKVDNKIEKITLFWQTEVDGPSSTAAYKTLTIYGLIHLNYVYKGNSVKTTAFDAIDDLDVSGFLVPLHQPTVRSMSLVEATQMATANTHLVFGSYEVFKKKWYQTFFGMLLIVIVLAVAAAVIAPGAVGAAGGALGSNAAFGAGLGLTGTSAVVAGAVANAIAAVMISVALSGVTTGLFGDKWGAIIGSIVMFVVGFGLSNGFSNLSLSTLMTPQNLLSLTSSLANGYNGYVQGNIAEMNEELVGMQKETEDQVKTIASKMEQIFGSNSGLQFNPMELTNAARGNGSSSSYVPETVDEFIHRTTMTGSDIVDVTLSLINNYADLNLELPT